jgi:hypothetical protein
MTQYALAHPYLTAGIILSGMFFAACMVSDISTALGKRKGDKNE